jgi:hypothetical protein
MHFCTVRTLAEVFHNILHFNMELGRDTRMVIRLAMFRHWYYVPCLEMFGPEKFIGHVRQNDTERQPLSTETYLAQAEFIDDLDPAPTLYNWFRPAKEDELFRLRLELAYVLARAGREPNELTTIYVLKDNSGVF